MAYAVTGPHPSPREKHKWKATELPPVASSRAVSRSITLPPLAAARLPIPDPRRSARPCSRSDGDEPGAMNVFLAVGGKLGVRLDADARTTTWRVDASGTGHACRLQGAPINHDAQPWHGIDSSTGLEAEANAPTVNCMRGVVDLVAANDSASRRHRQGHLPSAARPRRGARPRRSWRLGGRRPRYRPRDDGAHQARDPVGDRDRWLEQGDLNCWHLDQRTNGSTGAPGPDAQGADFLLLFSAATGSTQLFRWAGEWAPLPERSARASFTDGEAFPFVVEVDPRAIGDPLRLRFVALVGQAGTSSGDVAPSAGWWTSETWRGLWTR